MNEPLTETTPLFRPRYLLLKLSLPIFHVNQPLTETTPLFRPCYPLLKLSLLIFNVNEPLRETTPLFRLSYPLLKLSLPVFHVNQPLTGTTPLFRPLYPFKKIPSYFQCKHSLSEGHLSFRTFFLKAFPSIIFPFKFTPKQGLDSSFKTTLEINECGLNPLPAKTKKCIAGVISLKVSSFLDFNALSTV